MNMAIVSCSTKSYKIRIVISSMRKKKIKKTNQNEKKNKKETK
jgi:hypothetical protein